MEKRVSSYFAEIRYSKSFNVLQFFFCNLSFFPARKFSKPVAGIYRHDLTKIYSMRKSKRCFALESTESAQEFLNISEGVIDE